LKVRNNTYYVFSFFHTVVGAGAKVKQQKKRPGDRSPGQLLLSLC